MDVDHLMKITAFELLIDSRLLKKDLQFSL
jgi:hypothetical protein